MITIEQNLHHPFRVLHTCTTGLLRDTTTVDVTIVNDSQLLPKLDALQLLLLYCNRDCNHDYDFLAHTYIPTVSEGINRNLTLTLALTMT